MKMYENGVYRDMTDAEIFERESEQKKAEAAEKSRPMSREQVTDLLIRTQVNHMTVDDQTALRLKDYYPDFEDVIGQTVKLGFKFVYGGHLYKTAQADLTFLAHYAPGAGAESLYTRINESAPGDASTPIPYEGNMALESGKYYAQDGIICLCVRDTVSAVHQTLADLVGIYVAIA